MLKCLIEGKSYYCEYENKDGHFLVTTSYDISQEDKVANDGKWVSTSFNNYKLRDILIIDSVINKFYLLKDAYCVGINDIWNSIIDKHESKFNSDYTISSEFVENLVTLDENPLISQIKIFIPQIHNYVKNHNIIKVDNINEYKISLNKNNKNKYIEICSNNVDSILVSDDWHIKSSLDISINVSSYVELILHNPVKYNNLDEYIRELCIYLQLYLPNNISIEKIEVKIKESYYEIIYPYFLLKLSNFKTFPSVHDSLENFLANCYKKLPYRNSDSNRNIFYLLINQSRNIEDNFLMSYKFIENYYSFMNTQGNEILISFNKHDINDIKNKKKYAKELKALRNHYTHSGYHLKNKKLNVIYNKKNKKM